MTEYSITYYDKEELLHYGERAKTTQSFMNELTQENINKFLVYVAQLRGIPVERLIVEEIKEEKKPT